MIEGKHIEAFLAIDEHRHFARAADALGIAQSVLSKRLMRLEDQLGTALFDRGGKRRIERTRAGALFVTEAQAALDILRRTEVIGRNLARGSSGPLRIGYVFSAALCGLLPRLMRHLHTALASADLHPTPLSTPAQLAAIAAGRLDIGLIRPRKSYPVGAISVPVHTEELVLAFGRDHRFASRRNLSAADLSTEHFILPQFDEEVGLVDALRDLARSGGFDIPPVRRTGDFISAACLAAGGGGIILAPASLSRLALDGLVFHPVPASTAEVSLVMVYRADMPPAARDALEAIIAPLQAGEEPA